MAELERLANHLGDIGAICNDASFALMHAHCGVLRERVLRAADACFGHRLMRDRVVPGGVAVDLDQQGRRALKALLANIRRRFPALVELYDNTASLLDRTVATGILKPALARQYGAGGYVGRGSGRSFDARRLPGYAPYDSLDFEVPVREEGDVNARVWIRILEVEQSLSLVEQILERLPDGPVRDGAAGYGAGEGMALVEGFRGDILVWVRLGPDGTVAALPSARSVVVPVAAAGGGDRGQHRRRLSALQQILQLLLLGARSLETTMRKLLFRNIFRTAADGAAAGSRRGVARRLGASVDRAARRRLGRSLSIREVDAGSCNGCELEIHALNNAYYDLERFGIRFVASPRHADVLLVTGPVTREHARGAGANLHCDPGSEMGRRGRRLRPRWRLFCG